MNFENIYLKSLQEQVLYESKLKKALAILGAAFALNNVANASAIGDTAKSLGMNNKISDNQMERLIQKDGSLMKGATATVNNAMFDLFGKNYVVNDFGDFICVSSGGDNTFKDKSEKVAKLLNQQGVKTIQSDNSLMILKNSTK